MQHEAAACMQTLGASTFNVACNGISGAAVPQPTLQACTLCHYGLRPCTGSFQLPIHLACNTTRCAQLVPRWRSSMATSLTWLEILGTIAAAG